MSPNLIGTELEKTGKLTKDKNVNEGKETKDSKEDNVGESRSSITSIKNQDDIVNEVEEQRATPVSNRPNEITQLEKITKPV